MPGGVASAAPAGSRACPRAAAAALARRLGVVTWRVSGDCTPALAACAGAGSRLLATSTTGEGLGERAGLGREYVGAMLPRPA